MVLQDKEDQKIRLPRMGSWLWIFRYLSQFPGKVNREGLESSLDIKSGVEFGGTEEKAKGGEMKQGL